MLQNIEIARHVPDVSERVAHRRGFSEASVGAPYDDRVIALGDLVFIVIAAFRRHPHINNVLTHISGANWERVEQALRAILDPLAASSDLSPLARNIVDLMCADRGVSGRILKPYFRDLLAKLLSPSLAKLLTNHVTLLFLEFELTNQRAQEIPPQDLLIVPIGERGS